MESTHINSLGTNVSVFPSESSVFQHTGHSSPKDCSPYHFGNNSADSNSNTLNNLSSLTNSVGSTTFNSNNYRRSCCFGCREVIKDPVMLNALDRLWHMSCLKCSCCQATLYDQGPSFFTRENMILCRKDYLKMFGTTGTCSGCGSSIPADELVMRCHALVYHIKCFACARCQTLLQPGDRFSHINGSLFCEHEFPRLFGGNIMSPTNGRIRNNSGSSKSIESLSLSCSGDNISSAVVNSQSGHQTATNTKNRQKKGDSRSYSLHVS